MLAALCNHSIFLYGDFNVPNVHFLLVLVLLLQTYSVRLGLSVNFLSQIVTAPSGSSNTLDMLLTDNPDIVSSVAISDNFPGTDHSAIWFTISKSVSSSPVQKVLQLF